MTTPTDAAARDRGLGALLGVHAGDSLGATVEFSSWEQLRVTHPAGVREIVGGGPFDWPAGHATDDTDLTRAVLLAYLDPAVASGGDVVAVAAARMLDWYDGNWPGRVPGTAPKDVGNATRVGLARFRSSGDPRAAGAGPGQAGNGSLMRCLPTALAVPDREQRIRQAEEISAVTHDDPRCTVACAAYVEIAVALISGADPDAAVAEGLRVAQERAQPDVAAAITGGLGLTAAGLAATGPGPLLGGGTGYVLDSLAIAVAAVTEDRPLAEVLIDVVRIGGDTDTNGAIAGGLLGARDGAVALPPSWRAVLQFGDEFTAAVDRLF